MGGKAKLAIIIFITLTVVGAGLFLIGYLKPKTAGILIESQPGSSVYINNVQVGHTPYEGSVDAGEVVIRMVPDGIENSSATYETKLSLVPGVKTVVRRIFGDSTENSSGEMISFEQTGTEFADLSVVSSPDGAQITLDGQNRGFTPTKLTNITPGEHQLVVTARGYKDRIFTVRAVDGYRLTAIVDLAAGDDVLAREIEIPTDPELEEEKLTVEILSTPTGFLRVREESTTLSSEVGRVSPGDVLDLLDEDDKKEWYKIKFGGDSEGWVSAKYASPSGQLKD